MGQQRGNIAYLRHTHLLRHPAYRPLIPLVGDFRYHVMLSAVKNLYTSILPFQGFKNRGSTLFINSVDPFCK